MKKNKFERIHICSLCDGLNILEKYCHFCGFKTTIMTFDTNQQREKFINDPGILKYKRILTKYPRQENSQLVKCNQLLVRIQNDIQKIRAIKLMLTNVHPSETKNTVTSTLQQMIELTQELLKCYFKLYFSLFYNDFLNIGLYIKNQQSINSMDINEWLRHESAKYNKWKKSLENIIIDIKYDHILKEFDTQIDIMREKLSLNTITRVLSTTSFITKDQINIGIDVKGDNIDDEIEKINFEMDRLFSEKELEEYLS